MIHWPWVVALPWDAEVIGIFDKEFTFYIPFVRNWNLVDQMKAIRGAQNNLSHA